MTFCSLPPADRTRRTADFRRLLENALLDRTRDGDDVVWRLRASDASESESRRLAALEARCCDGIRFEVKRDGDSLLWRISGPPSTSAVLDTFYELPALVMTDRADELWVSLDRASCAGDRR